MYLKTYLSNTPNTVDQIRRICICICLCKYKYVFDPSPVTCPESILWGVISGGGGGGGSMLRIGYVNRWNQCDFSTVHQLYIWRHRWILALLLIFTDWYKHSNTTISGSKCVLVYNLKTKSDFDHICSHYKTGYIINIINTNIYFSYFYRLWIWHPSIIHCAKFEEYTCSICDVAIIPMNACSSLFNTLKCC